MENEYTTIVILDFSYGEDGRVVIRNVKDSVIEKEFRNDVSAYICSERGLGFKESEIEYMYGKDIAVDAII